MSVQSCIHVLRHSMLVRVVVLLSVSALTACGDDRVAAPADAPNIDLQVTKTANRAIIQAGDTVRFTVVVRNGGPLDATNVFGGDTLPTGLTYESHSQSQGVYSSSTGLWTIGALGNTAQATLTILARGQASAIGQTLVNRAGALSTAFRDSVPANDSASASVQVIAGEAPPPPPPPPVGLVFSSSWNTATGNTPTAVTDGGAWNEHYPCSRSDVLDIVPGAPLGWTLSANVFRSNEIGNNACGAIQRTNAVPQSTTHWGRMYFRNDETQQSNSFHNFNYNFVGNIQWVFFNRKARVGGFEVDVRMPGTYPFISWRLLSGPGSNPLTPPVITLQNGTWYRYEWQVEYISSTNMRFWPRIYTMTGTEPLYTASDFYQSDTPNAGTATLASWYAAGNSFVVPSLSLARHIGIGNEGRATTTLPGEKWYVANFAISTAGWIGQ